MNTSDLQLICPIGTTTTVEYKKVLSYSPEQQETTHSEYNSSIQFKSIDISDRKEHIRTLNKIVSNWR